MKLAILYRGSLSSCNYGCGYCPFALRRETRDELREDAAALSRFTSWVQQRGGDQLSVFFTPWGEALIRRHYREAIAALSWLPQIQRVAVQTNLSSPVGWLRRARAERIGIWATYHPTQVTPASFLERCRELQSLGIRYSVGAVGERSQISEIRDLRSRLPSHVYLWVNARKERPDYYQPEDVERLSTIDRLFHYNLKPHQSRGRSCRTGQDVVSVDHQGTVRRCHFVDTPLGNLYTQDIESMLAPRPCERSRCSCHIGYVHLDHLGLGQVFGSGILERVPADGQPLPLHQVSNSGR